MARLWDKRNRLRRKGCGQGTCKELIVRITDAKQCQQYRQARVHERRVQQSHPVHCARRPCRIPPERVTAHGTDRTGNSAEITYAAFSAFQAQCAPRLFLVLERYLYTKFFLGDFLTNPATPLYNAERLVLLPQRFESKTPLADQPELSWMMGWWFPEPSIGNAWDLRHSSSRDGLSCNRFETKVFKYPHPTLVILDV